MTKTNINLLKLYLLGTLLQIFTVCLLIFILKINNIQYPQIFNILFLIIGGSSSAIWGIIVSKKSNRVNSYKRILADFFAIKQQLSHYAIVIIFLIINFGLQIINARVINQVQWYSFLLLFFQAIIFGGIEEIGWRYTFQPLLEKKLNFEISTILTFSSWGLWHYMYFYVTNNLISINHISFLIGLLGSSFILGAIYKTTKSLWLCVLYHSLFNTFSQTLIANNLYTVVICNLICIILSILIVNTNKLKIKRLS